MPLPCLQGVHKVVFRRDKAFILFIQDYLVNTVVYNSKCIIVNN